jgi:hypothetical protein
MLQASDALAGAVGKLAAGNVGAACVLGRIVQDPFAGFMILMDLESTDLGAKISGRYTATCITWIWTGSSRM